MGGLALMVISPENWEFPHFFMSTIFYHNFQLWEVVKLKLHVFAYTCIFSLNTSRSRKLIFKADL